jgi:hypothetical protein
MRRAARAACFPLRLIGGFAPLWLAAIGVQAYGIAEGHAASRQQRKAAAGRS